MNDFIILGDPTQNIITLSAPISFTSQGITYEIPVGTKIIGSVEYRDPVLNNNPTALNKANLLTDTTQAALGMPPNSSTYDGTPNLALMALLTQSFKLKIFNYTGSGFFGPSNPTILNFTGIKPLIIFINGRGYPISEGILYGESTFGKSTVSSGTTANIYGLSVTWSINSVSWYGESTNAQLSNTSIYDCYIIGT